MKQNVLSMLLISMFLVLALSCKKEESFKLKEQHGVTNKHLKDVVGNRTLYYYMEYYYNYACKCMVGEYTFIFCTWPSQNCLATVTITGNSDLTLKNLAATFYSCYSNNQVPRFFSNFNYSLLFPGIDSLNGVKDSIINSQIILYRHVDNDDTGDYYIGLPYGRTLTEDWSQWIPQSRVSLQLVDTR